MKTSPDRESAAAVLRDASIADVHASDLSVVSTKGISHDHWAVGDSGRILRIPRMNQWGLAPDAALDYQAAAFRRAAESGCVPALHAVLPVSETFPRGALVAEQIDGRAPKLPDDLHAIADALVALHAIAAPADAAAAPLQTHRNPVSATLEVIEGQAAYLSDAGIASESETAILDDLDWARDFAGGGEPDFALCFVGTDTHPGNFLIDVAGKAWFVDLEKALYGAAPIDLAHTSLPTSTGWDPDCTGIVRRADVRAFYRRYLEGAGTRRAEELSPWLLPMRRLTWLRTITWFARWKASWSATDHAAARDTSMSEHVRAHVTRCFEPDAIRECREDWLSPRALDI